VAGSGLVVGVGGGAGKDGEKKGVGGCLQSAMVTGAGNVEEEGRGVLKISGGVMGTSTRISGGIRKSATKW